MSSVFVTYQFMFNCMSLYFYLHSWFDAKITTCSTTKAKKVSKKEDPWHLDDKSGSLFCMPNNDEFVATFPYRSPPYVFMQPVDDAKRVYQIAKEACIVAVNKIILSCVKHEQKSLEVK